jgi:hypothetical protein
MLLGGRNPVFGVAVRTFHNKAVHTISPLMDNRFLLPAA